MKFSYQWLRECVPGLELAARDLEQLITVRTAESEGVETAGELLAGARVAKVLVATPEGRHLTRALVDTDAAAPITVACGAPNCRAGMQTVWVPVGTKTVGGIESNGMLASPQELGFNRDHAGIIEWSESAIGLRPDQIIEIDNKSLTHRPDLWGHVGMAREVAAITKRELRDPVEMSLLPGGSDSYDVRVEDFELCPRFSTVVFEGVKVRPSPWWLQYRLTSVGLNPINNIVDITNYVMAELAQPMHAFDREKLRGDRLVIRRARAGERLLALNDEEYELNPAHGVVGDAEGAVSIAGVIGGKESAISEATTDIVFESANWKASSIRKTSSALKVRTDASMRYEKAQDPANTVRALARAIALMKMICPEARLVGRLTDVYESLPKTQSVRLNLETLNRKLGREVEPAEVREILERLAFGVRDEGGGMFTVTVPTWRATKDISCADDLVEEIGRMIGYDTIRPTPPRALCTVPPDEPRRLWLRELRGRMTARGFTEVYNYSFLSDEQAARFQVAAEDQVRILNPIASDQNILRSSLVPGIVANIELNAKHLAEFRIFEIGREIHSREPALPLEITRLVAAVYAADGDGKAGLMELKRIAEIVAPGVRVAPVEETLSYEHPARTANLMMGDSAVGRLFAAHPSVVEAGRAAILDLNLDRLEELLPARVTYRPIRRFPSSAFDLSFVTPARELAGNIEANLRDFAGPLLESVEYLREYAGAQAGEGRKSVTFRFTLGAAERTLSSEEVNAVRARVIEMMRGLGYESRA